MSIISFGNKSIAYKLNVTLIGTVVTVLCISGFFLGNWLSARMEDEALADLQRTNRQIVDMIDAYAQQLESSASMLGAQFAAPLPNGCCW